MNNQDITKETKRNSLDKNRNLIRTLFLKLLTVFSIILVYFYLAEYFGSISTSFLIYSEILFRFDITMLIFTFLSVLAGSLVGLISGFFGELFYQMAFYSSIKLGWCIIVGLLGLFVGVYDYKPLKYKKREKVFYTYLSLLFSSIIIALFIEFFQAFDINVDLEDVVFNNGFKFFIISLFSMVSFVPVILFLYDRLFATEERHIYRLLLTHHPIYQSDHTFRLKFGRTYISFCSRCSGAIIGGLVSIFSMRVITKAFQISINPELAVLLCIILPIPGILDWGTQRLRYRTSTTESRLFTGFIIGMALYFLSFTDKYYFFMLLLVTFYFSLVGLLIYIGHKNEMKESQKDSKSLPLTEEDQFE